MFRICKFVLPPNKIYKNNHIRKPSGIIHMQSEQSFLILFLDFPLQTVLKHS